jgi:peroxin-19
MERVKELSNLLESDGSDDNAAPLTNAQSTHSSQQQQQQNQPSTEELAARLRAIAESTRESTDNLFNAASSAAAGGDANVPPGEADEAMLERVLQQLDSEPGMMQELVQQILSKDVLYEPMVELRDKYPQWLAANQLSLSSEDRARYARQHQLIGMICQEYESADVNYDRLTDLMGAVQQLGQPPREIVSQLAPDFPLDADGQPQVSPENCVVQ